MSDQGNSPTSPPAKEAPAEDTGVVANDSKQAEEAASTPPAAPSSDLEVAKTTVVEQQPVVKTQQQKDKEKMLALLGDRALRAGSKGKMGKGMSKSNSPTGGSTLGFSRGSGGLARWQSAVGGGALANINSKFLVLGDGIGGPFMSLCLRLNGMDCDLVQYQPTSDADCGTIVLTPSVTQLMGDALNVNVPSGSVIGRLLSFDHVGNDLCDIDLNEFREQGESPTFFACDRKKIEASLMSLCKVGTHACNVLGSKLTIDRGGIQEVPGGGVRVTFSNGQVQDYAGVISTTRNQKMVPELTLDEKDLRARAENDAIVRKIQNTGHRWIEMCVPPLPELTDQFEKRFTPGSQEVVELLNPRGHKMMIRPTMMATKLFYNVAMTIPENCPDPRLKSTSMKLFWDDTVEGWTGGMPGYVTHTMFKPMFNHVQQHWSKSSGMFFRSPQYLLPHWTEGGGRLMKVGQSVHSTSIDGVDLSDAQGFTDSMILARGLASGECATKILDERKLQVMEEMDHHKVLDDWAVKERGAFSHAAARFRMKMMRGYKRHWRACLNNYITMLPKNLPK